MTSAGTDGSSWLSSWPASAALPPGPTGEPAGSLPAFDFVAHQFYEVPMLARIRRPSQLLLVRWHLAIAVASAGSRPAPCPPAGPPQPDLAGDLLDRLTAIRATVWICGGNLPLVPGDSCHYLEVATSVFRGEGPVKHYVESFFTDYPRIRQGQGVLDDWATPLDAYLLAASCSVSPASQPGAVARDAPWASPRHAAS